MGALERALLCKQRVPWVVLPLLPHQVAGLSAHSHPFSPRADNWAVALTDIARLVRAQQPEEAYECLTGGCTARGHAVVIWAG